MKALFKILAALCLPLVLVSCTQAGLILTRADLKPKGQVATPAIFEGATPSIAEWENTRRPQIQKQLQDHVYGALPADSDVTIIERIVIDENAFGGRGRLEEIVMTATAIFDGVASESRPFIIELITPNNVDGKAPVILMESFSPRWSAIRHPGVTAPEGIDRSADGGLMLFIFGRYVSSPPLPEILDRGYGVALIFPSEIVPDRSASGLAALASLSEGYKDDETRWGAIGAWGWGYSRMIDVLIDHPRIDPQGFVAYGHSRYGKAAMVAAAYDSRVAAVISHQSGTGGASLNKRKKGESIEDITGQYPHWFSKTYAGYAGREEELPIDQHHLLALIAPRPILLGNARRDVWSDPNGALKAAIGADPVWKLYGADKGLRQQRYKPFNPDADLSLWIRSGTHGVVKEDWPAFLEFLDAHF